MRHIPKMACVPSTLITWLLLAYIFAITGLLSVGPIKSYADPAFISTGITPNLLIVIGAGLTGGSYLLGQVLSSRKRKQILETNKAIKEANKKAQVENKDLENMVRSRARSDIEQWEKENRTRGKEIYFSSSIELL